MTNTTLQPNVAKFRQPTYEIDPVYLNRWSPRSFLEKEVPEKDLLSLFEAARWAPSGYNLQPWKFIIARDQKSREKFYPFIYENNLKWCEKAPVLVMIISKTTSENGLYQSHTFDTGAAWGFLALEATRKGLITHPMIGFDYDKARTALNIPEDYAIQALVAIGYQGEKEALPEPFQEREQPNSRVPLTDLLFNGEFGEPVK